METSTARKAIQAALNADWDTAIAANLQLLSQTPQEIDVLMRLSYAYYATGDLKSARKYAKLAEEIEPNNALVQKCIEKCKNGVVKNQRTLKFPKISVDTFLEEPGRTKIVSLKYLGTSKILVSLTPGEEVSLTTSKRQASIQTLSADHIGHLPDDIASWVIYNKKHGGSILAHIKSVAQGQVKVFLKLKTT